MVAWMCALGALFALSFWLVSELPDVAEQGIADRLLDGFWFAFIASTTIGLGDFVPPAREWHVFLVHFLFLLVGVTLVGLLISAAVRSYADLQGKIEEKIRLKAVADTSKSESGARSNDGAAQDGGFHDS